MPDNPTWLSVEQREEIIAALTHGHSSIEWYEIARTLLESNAEGDRIIAELREQNERLTSIGHEWAVLALQRNVDINELQQQNSNIEKYTVAVASQAEEQLAAKDAEIANWKRQATDYEQELERHSTDRVNQRKEVADTKQENDRLRAALKSAKFVMDHFGDYLNDADIVDAVENETGVSNDLVDAAFKVVDEALAATPPLDLLIEVARKHVMTPEEQDKQSRSFTYGNVKISNPDVTREDVDRTVDSMRTPPATPICPRCKGKGIVTYCHSGLDEDETGQMICPECTPPALNEVREWVFDRYINGRLKAEGARVHSATLEDAIQKAKVLFSEDCGSTFTLRESTPPAKEKINSIPTVIKAERLESRFPGILLVARNIVNQILDISEISVGKRQAINDQCDAFVVSMLADFISPAKEGK